MSEPVLDEKELVKRVRAGDEHAARALMDYLQPVVLRSVRVHLPQRLSEADMVQAIMIKVFTKLDQYSGLGPLAHWVSRIAVNTCLNQLQHERVRPELNWSELSDDQQRVVESLAVTDDALPASQEYAARELVVQLLTQLKPQERLIITLMYLEQRSVAEIRQVTGWSVPLVKVRAFRARRKMRRLLDTLMQEKRHESRR
jgi:RNA polymerase sigma factor (sigma-70 family)